MSKRLLCAEISAGERTRNQNVLRAVVDNVWHFSNAIDRGKETVAQRPSLCELPLRRPHQKRYLKSEIISILQGFLCQARQGAGWITEPPRVGSRYSWEIKRTYSASCEDRDIHGMPL